jgi:hypothetical protein
LVLDLNESLFQYSFFIYLMAHINLLHNFWASWRTQNEPIQSRVAVTNGTEVALEMADIDGIKADLGKW